ncbi:MAG: hypothetical protein HY275_09685 [Gemmatimonadetes bacterium]|nr:hypothetical protein [Gemmatimonadota bacterium]
MAENPVTLLRAHAKQAPWNARGLAAYASGLADAAGVRPTNAVARAAPSMRAVRFYVSIGLLDRPEGAGTAATYGYKHLIQLLAIKVRQREGQTLEVIKKEMTTSTGDALERRVATALAPVLGAAPVPVADDGALGTPWRRAQVADGIELHVRADSPAARDDVLAAVRDAVRGALGHLER